MTFLYCLLKPLWARHSWRFNSDDRRFSFRVSEAMSYDTLPDNNGTKREALTTYPKFGHGTSGTEVAEAFTENIKGKNGTAPSLSNEAAHLTLLQLSSLEYRQSHLGKRWQRS